jgi:hypothetical protein
MMTTPPNNKACFAAVRRGCVGLGDEQEGERPLWGLRKATTSRGQLHEPRGRVGRKPDDETES